MTEKEKAQELVDKFLQYTPVEYEYEYAIQCALIAVDEILNSLKSCWDEEGALIAYKYWQEVKQEIENIYKKYYLTIKNKNK
jgi:hypothetical protein